jgi:hypothetical protein
MDGGSCWHPMTRREVERLCVEKRHFTMEGVLVCALPVSSRSWWKKAGLAERPDSHQVVGKTKPTGESRRVGDRDVRGRLASNHEKDENSLTGWTGSPKRIWRRETLGSSIVSVQSRKTSTDTDFRGEARKSGRDLVGNDRTRVHEFFFECVDGSCWWCASGVCKGSRGPSRR